MMLTCASMWRSEEAAPVCWKKVFLTWGAVEFQSSEPSSGDAWSRKPGWRQKGWWVSERKSFTLVRVLLWRGAVGRHVLHRGAKVPPKFPPS